MPTSQNQATVQPLTDSVWYWVLLFSVAALASIAASRPVYEARQNRIERRFQVRAHVGFATSRVGEPGAQFEGDGPPDIEITNDRLIGLAPIAAFVLATAVGSSIMLFLERRRGSRTTLGKIASQTASNAPSLATEEAATG